MRLRRFTPIIIFLVVGIFATGCSISGYHLGKRIDSRNSDSHTVVNFDDITIGKDVQIFMIENRYTEGYVTTITEDSIYVSPFTPVNDDAKDATSSYSLNDIVQIKVKSITHGGRILGTVFGSLLDVGTALLIYTLIVSPYGWP